MTLALNSYQTMAVGILLYYLGKFLKARIKFLRTYCIPNPVIGGILFALLNLALHQSEHVLYEHWFYGILCSS